MPKYILRATGHLVTAQSNSPQSLTILLHNHDIGVYTQINNVIYHVLKLHL
jgi:hypothetical protein